jgi:hypothetical protein
MKETSCPNCGMSKSEWMRNDGRGVSREGLVYCCEGCAVKNQCTCRYEGSRKARDVKGRRPAHVHTP